MPDPRYTPTEVRLTADLADRLAAELRRMETRVHNHAPYRPVCNERILPSGQLRGACLNDDGGAA